MSVRDSDGSAAQITPDAVAASLARNDGGFGRDQQTYYDQPVLRKAHWGWEIVGYFFVGGLSGASGLLSILAARTDEVEHESLIRNARYTALVGASLSGGLLIKDLGRPERFLHMLRICKWKSPMSVGVYSLMAFSLGAGLAVLDQAKRDGLIAINPARSIPTSLRDALFALGSGLMASYTGVLVSATAIPVWYTGRWHLPALFVCSATAAGCALNAALLALADQAPMTLEKLESLEGCAGLAEGMLLLDLWRHAGDVGKPLFSGTAGRKLRSWTVLGGIALPLAMRISALFGRRRGAGSAARKARTLVTSFGVLVGGLVFRAAVLEAGRSSANDPRAYFQHP